MELFGKGLKRIARNTINLIQGFSYTSKERRHAMVGPAKLWKMKRDFQIKFLKKSGLLPKHYLLDIGCGTLRGGIPFIEYLDEKKYGNDR